MKHNDEVIRRRDRLLRSLPDLRAVLRGSLLQRAIRHRQGCPKCDRGQGHPVWVLAVGYPKGVIRHLSLHKDQVPQVRRFLKNHETVDELWEDWMRQAEAVLEDEALLATVYEALRRRHLGSATHGRPGTPAEVVLRMLLLKHIRDWSFADLEREVRANLL